MVTTKALIFALERKIDRLNSERKKAIDTVNMCHALTESMYFIIKDRAQKYEQDKRNDYELGPLEVRGFEIEAKTPGPVTIFDLPGDIYRDLDLMIVASKRGCGKKTFALTKMESGDTSKSLTNPFWKSSYSWEQGFCNIANGKLHVTNGVDFKAEGIIIDYLKRHGDLHCPSLVKPPKKYIDWNGQEQKTDTVLLLDDLKGEIINLAAMMLTRDLGDPNDFQLQLSNNLNTESTSKN
jgi:hypothetical protein